MPDIGTAISAGLLGSVVTAFFSYLVQQRLAKSRRVEEERRLAFVYLVRLTELVAAEEVILKVVDLLASAYGKFMEADISKIRSVDAAIDSTHVWCAIASEYLRECMEGQESEGRDNVMSFIVALKGVAEGLQAYEIPLNLLAQMPKDAVVAYHSVTVSLSALKTHINRWEGWGQADGKALISAQVLHSQWISIKSLSANTRILREALIVNGKIPRTEADRILRAQVVEGSQKVFSSLVTPKLDVVVAAVRSMIKEKKAEKGTIQ